MLQVQLEQSLRNSTKAKQNEITKLSPFLTYIAVSNTMLVPRGSYFCVLPKSSQPFCFS